MTTVMDNEAKELRTYVQEIQNKISVAVALAVLRSKPENVPTADYVCQLQQRFLKEWQKSSTPDVFQDKLVALELTKVAQDFAEVLPDEPTVLFDDSPIVPLSSVQLEANLPPFQMPCPPPDSDVIDRHGTLFRSLIQLKFAVDTRKTIPFGQVREYLRDMQCLTGEAESSLADNCGDKSPKKSQHSDDSGVGISGGTAPKAPDSVSSSLFRSITNSTSMEVLITKTTESLLAYVYTAVFHTPFESYYRWKGSLLEKTCYTLASALVDAQCRTIVISFLEESLNQLWMLDDIFKSFSLEYQLKILSRLCAVSEVCSNVLNKVMAYFEEFADTSAQLQPPSPSNVHLVEKIPYFLQFAEMLFYLWKSRVVKNTDFNATVCSVTSSVWQLKQDNDGLTSRIQYLLKSWRDILEKLSVSCIEAHPLVNAHLLSTLASIDSLIGLREHDDEMSTSFLGDLREY